MPVYDLARAYETARLYSGLETLVVSASGDGAGGGSVVGRHLHSRGATDSASGTSSAQGVRLIWLSASSAGSSGQSSESVLVSVRSASSSSTGSSLALSGHSHLRSASGSAQGASSSEGVAVFRRTASNFGSSGQSLSSVHAHTRSAVGESSSGSLSSIVHGHLRTAQALGQGNTANSATARTTHIRTAAGAGVSSSTSERTRIVLRTAPTKINELLNSSFEQGVSGWTPFSPNGGTATVTQSDDYALFGDYSLKMVPNTDFQWFIRYTGGFAVSGLSTYTVSGYILSPIRSTFSQIAVYEFNSSGGVVGIQYGAINLVTTSSGWVRNRLTFTTKSATRSIWIQVSGSAKTGEAVYHDGYMIQTGSLVADWQPAELVAKGTETATGLHISPRSASGSGVGGEMTTSLYVAIRAGVSAATSSEIATKLLLSVRSAIGTGVGTGTTGDIYIVLEIDDEGGQVLADASKSFVTASGGSTSVSSAGTTILVEAGGVTSTVESTGDDGRVLVGV